MTTERERLLRERLLIQAVQRLSRWVGTGIANDAYINCVSPDGAKRDLDFANQVVREVEAAR